MRLYLLLLGLVWLAVPQQARAQTAVDWEVSGSATVGFTDNVVNTPEPVERDSPQPEADGFGTVSPAARLQFETPGVTQTLGYVFGYSFYLLHSDANSFSNALGYGLRVETSPTTSLTLNLTGAQSTVQQLTLLAPAQAGTAAPTPGNQPDGTDVLVTAGLGQGFSANLSETITFTQALQATVGRTIIADGPDIGTYVGSLGFSLAKAFEVNSLSFEQANDIQFTPDTEGPPPAAAVAQILHRVRVVWGHQFSDSWGSQVGAGVVFGYDALNLDTPVPAPVGAASLNWQGNGGRFGVSYAHDAVPNVLLRQVVVSDAGAINGLVEFPRGFDVGGSAGVQVTRSLFATEQTTPGMSVLADVALGYVPGSAPVRLDARYQFSRQFGLGDDDPTGALFPTIQRHAVLLTTTFAYPGTPAAGGAAPFVALPPPSANPDIIAQQAPRSERAVDDEEKALKDELLGKKEKSESE